MNEFDKISFDKMQEKESKILHPNKGRDIADDIVKILFKVCADKQSVKIKCFSLTEARDIAKTARVFQRRLAKLQKNVMYVNIDIPITDINWTVEFKYLVMYEEVQ